jgi:hypothetical protein
MSSTRTKSEPLAHLQFWSKQYRQDSIVSIFPVMCRTWQKMRVMQEFYKNPVQLILYCTILLYCGHAFYSVQYKYILNKNDNVLFCDRRTFYFFIVRVYYQPMHCPTYSQAWVDKSNHFWVV